MLKNIYIFVFLSQFLFFSVVSAETFFRNLRLGDFGDDIKELQKILNSESDTAVAVLGEGSLGQETNYFGLKTEQAVIKFQSKYKDEILIPNGLSFPTGFVGPATRQKLNNLISANSNNQNIVTNTQSPITNKIPSSDELYFAEFKKQYPDLVQTGTTSVSGPPVLIHVFPQYVKSGEKIRLYTNLGEEKIDIFIEDKVQKNIEQDNLGFFEVTVPNLSAGQYNVYFEKKWN